MSIVLLLALLFQPPPAVSMTVQLEEAQAVVYLLSSDPLVSEVTLQAGGQTYVIPTPLSKLTSVSLPLPAGCGAVELIVTGATSTGDVFSRFQGSILHACPIPTYIPLVNGATIGAP